MPKASHFFDLYVLQGLAKGFSVFYFVLLPVFYAQHFISSKLLGNIGAFSIAAVILGAVAVTRWLHRLSTKRLLELSAGGVILASCLLLLAVRTQSVGVLSAAYGLIGLAGGMAISGINAVVAARTEKGKRFGAIARLSMLVDVVRIVFPLIVSAALLWANVTVVVVLVLITAVVFAVFVERLPKTIATAKNTQEPKPTSAFHNKGFRFIMSLEFLDSFSSSQLFVFLPLLFLAKGHSLESSLVLQTAIFLGYFCGRWFVGQLARRYSGLRAVAWAEMGMFVAIGALLITTPLPLLYLLSFALGVFARGTSPAIKSLAFDNLQDDQIRQGSALHVVAGDSGSALAQFAFGLLVAWYGVKTPFYVAAVVALLIALLCILDKKLHQGQHQVL